MSSDDNEFYEDDEPVEDVIAAWENAPKGITMEPLEEAAKLLDTTPDVAGTIATCKTCGTSIGPVTGPRGCSLIVQCGCGTVLEVWPT